jgi:heme oxygenase
MPTLLLQRLKADTEQAHRRIERELGLGRRKLTRDDYILLLRRLFGFHDAWELAAAEVASDRPFLDARRKSDLIVADLRHLGVSIGEVAALPRCRPLMPMRDEADWLGATYVVEGATLGGQVIAKALSADLNLAPEAGLAFFSSYGAEVGRMWRETLATFERIRLWLCEGR